MPGTKTTTVAAALLLLAGCGGARGRDPAGGDGQLAFEPSLGEIDGLDDVFEKPRPIPGNPYVVLGGKDRLVKDLAVLEIAPLDVGGPEETAAAGPLKVPEDREIALRQRRRERPRNDGARLEELCSLSSGSTEEKAIARARAALLRFARRKVRRDVPAVVFADEPYTKEVKLRKGRFRAEVCGRMDAAKLRR
jgi:hypothetical protein